MKGQKSKEMKDKVKKLTKKERQSRDDKARAEFKKVSDEKAKQEHYDWLTNEVVKIGKEIRAMWIQARDVEEEMKIKTDQLDKGSILELYNGMIKPKGKILTEYAILEHDFKMLIYKINKHRDQLRHYEFKDKDIEDMITGEFSYDRWVKTRLDKDAKEEKEKV